MASLTTAKGGRYWRIKFFNANKRPKEKSIYRPTIQHDPDYGLTRLQAERLVRDLERDIDNGWNPWDEISSPTATSILTLSQAINETLQYIRPNLEQSTYETREDHFDLLREYFGGSYPVSNITTSQLNTFINSNTLRNKPASFSYKMLRKEILVKLYKYLNRQYSIEKPELEVYATRAEKSRYYNKDFKTFLLKEELIWALDYLPSLRSKSRHSRELLRAYYLLAFFTGRRRADLLAIQSEWISDAEPVIQLFDDSYMTKAKRFEYIPLSEEAWNLMKSIRSTGPIFKNFNQNFVTKEFKKLLRLCFPKEKADKLSLHKLRDSAIMHFLHREGMSTTEVMERVGHISLRSLDKYVHPQGKQILNITLDNWEKSDIRLQLGYRLKKEGIQEPVIKHYSEITQSP
jgi:integrase